MPALRHRSFRLFLGSPLLYLTGLALELIVVSWQVYRLTDSAFMLGLINFASLLPGLPASLAAGVLSDRLSRRQLILTTETVLLGQALILAGLTWSGRIQVWHIFVLSIIWGVASALEQPARMAFMADIVEPGDLSNAIALNASTYNTAYILGPALASLLIIPLGEAGCFFINAVSYVPVLAALLIIPAPPPLPTGGASSLTGSLREGFHYVYQHPTLLVLLLTIGVSSFGGMSYLSLMPALVRETLGLGARELGFLLTAAGIGAVIGALWVAGLKPVRRGAWLTLGAILAPLWLFGLSFSRALPLSLGLIVLTAAASALRNLLCNSFVQLLAERQYHGRVMSLYALLFNGMPRAGALVLGGVAELVGVSWALTLGAALALAWAVGLTIWQPAVRRLE